MPLPSPTTTRAVKLNRRPPLTTLATRLMVTTRSTYAVFSAAGAASWLRRSRRSRRSPPSPPPPPPPRRCWGGIRNPSFRCCRFGTSELQSGLAGALGDRGDPAVVLVAGPVEDDRVDPGRLGPLADQLADLTGQVSLAAVGGAQPVLQGGGGGEGVAELVVDDLRHDVPVGPGDDETRTLRGAVDPLAHTDVPTLARDRLLRVALGDL